MNPIDQLKYLKTLTITTNSVHDAQIHQLKNYPLVIPNILSATVSIDIETKLIEYNLTFKDDKAPRKTKALKKSLTSITQWVQYILWDDANVVFKNHEIKL
jgi:hypothetical protein